MIRILKEGKPQKYITTCSECGCEFEYELEDVKIEYSICLTSYPGKYNTYVICPCCGTPIHHDIVQEKVEVPKIDYPSKEIENNPCETCIYRFGPRDGLGNPIAGDSPCQWCPHYKYKVTC